MSQRRLYADRTQLYVKDLADQLPGKYLVFLVNSHGEKTAFSCDNIEIAPGAVIFSRASEVVTSAQGEKKKTVVAACGIESDWTFIERDRFIELTGKEYEKEKIADGENRKAILTELFGEDGITQVMVTPDGKPFAIPVDEKLKAEYKEGLKAAEKKTYDDSKLYA